MAPGQWEVLALGWPLGSGRCWLWDGSWAAGGIDRGMAPGQWEALAMGWLLGSGRCWLWEALAVHRVAAAAV